MPQWQSNGPTSLTEHLLDALDDFFMLQQSAALRVSPADFYGFDEAGIVFEHPFDGFFDKLSRVLAGPRQSVEGGLCRRRWTSAEPSAIVVAHQRRRFWASRFNAPGTSDNPEFRRQLAGV